MNIKKKKLNDKDRIIILQKFATKLIKNTKDINPKYAKIISENFWDLF